MFRLDPIVRNAIWGCEHWLVSVRPDSPSRVVGAEGMTFAERLASFPLLVKTIDAVSRLSVQVHPNDRTAKTVGGEAKSEMWCVLGGGPIFAGFRPGVTPEDVERAVGDGSFEELLVRFDAKPGECFYIPGGLVHAIGEGTRVYEVQQSSDTTFRLYDWGRVDAEGKPRALHVREALAAMDLSLPPPVPSQSVSCPYFDFRQVAGGELHCPDRWTVVYLPQRSETFVLGPGERMSVDSPALVTAVNGYTAE